MYCCYRKVLHFGILFKIAHGTNLCPDIIDELVKKGKEVEAVYFASESGLTERFQPVSLLKSYLQRTEKKGNHNSSATVCNLG